MEDEAFRKGQVLGVASNRDDLGDRVGEVVLTVTPDPSLGDDQMVRVQSLPWKSVKARSFMVRLSDLVSR